MTTTTTQVIVEVESKSTRGTWYRQWIGPEGPVFCECPAHVKGIHAKGKPAGERPDCKHMRDMRGTPECEAAMALARNMMTTGTTELRTIKQQHDPRIRFIELVEVEDDNRKGATVLSDLTRYIELEA